ncbi:MAG: DUF2288 domain-containing protein [Gallionella sp.]|nr:DUF2288 domain-containing protein [Gallionella sp.]
MSNPNQQEIYRTKINLETSKIAWKELQRFFASGKALMVSSDLDLVEAAFQMSEDNVEQVRQWAVSGKLARVPDEPAREWFETDALVWAVVVSPWVLVQPVGRLH